MATRPIIMWPEPWLNAVSAPVLESEFGSAPLQEIITDLIGTMNAASGLGLSAPQLGVHKQVIVIRLATPGLNPVCLCNPTIAVASKKTQRLVEGCLSLPEVRAPIERALSVTVHGRLFDGTSVELEYTGLEAAIIQHEIDHLNGITLFDRVGPVKQGQIRHSMWKVERQLQRNSAQQELIRLNVQNRLRDEAKDSLSPSEDYTVSKKA